MNNVIGIIVVILILAVVAYLMLAERRKVSQAKKRLVENQKPGHLHIFRGYSDKGRDINVIIDEEVVTTLDTSNKRHDIVEITKPCVVTVSRPGKFKSSIEILQEELESPIFIKVVASKYSNDIVKVPKEKM